MKRYAHLCLFLSSLGLPGCGGAIAPTVAPVAVTNVPETPAKLPVPELPPGDGRWCVTSATFAGVPMPNAVTDTISLTISGQQYELNFAGAIDKGTCTVDRTTRPYRVTINGMEGPHAGKTVLAICEFSEAAEMRVCYDMTGTAFPEAFESTAKNGHYLVVYKRAK